MRILIQAFLLRAANLHSYLIPPRWRPRVAYLSSSARKGSLIQFSARNQIDFPYTDGGGNNCQTTLVVFFKKLLLSHSSFGGYI